MSKIKSKASKPDVSACEGLERIIDSLDDAVFLYDSSRGAFRDCNAAAARMFGYAHGVLRSMTASMLHVEPAAFESFDAMARESMRQLDSFFTEWPLRRADGSTFAAEIRLRRLNLAVEAAGTDAGTGGEQLFVAAVRDLTQQHAWEDSLALYRQVFDNASEAIMITDEHNRIVSVNAAFSRITGWSAEEVTGRNPSLLSSGKQAPEFYRDMWRTLCETGVWQGEVINRRHGGQYYPEWLSISTVRNRQGKVTHYLAIFSDITERKRAEGLIHRYSWFDSLTDLPNKALLIDRINQAIIAAQNDGRSLYLMAINLNRLKHINDSLGHSVGDEVLKTVAQRLIAGTREGDTVSRVTGDDFVIVVPRLNQPHRAMNLAERLLDAVHQPIGVAGNALHITANAGIAAYPADGADPETLLRNADAALNHSRQQGHDKVAFFEPHMNQAIIEKMSLHGELAEALRRGEFILHFQPQASLTDGRLAGIEALIRWNHPKRGMVSPGLFVPMAEEVGLIVPIGEWVIDEACRCLAAWRAAGHERLLLAVNLSAVQFTHPNLVAVVRAAIERHGVEPASLELEITEGVAMHEAAEVLARLRSLRRIGVKISIDDFGTGYSSLAYLRRFPVDKLKIDQSFVHDMPASSESTSIVRAVIALGHGLGVTVIAEGVETTAQRASLKQLGCDEIQGYILSRPVDFESMSQLLIDWPGDG